MTQKKPRVLVTGAAGHTGLPAVQHLIERGFPVRAFVRRKDHRSEHLERIGAEVCIGNLFDVCDLRSAMRGVQRAYHCPPFGSNLLHGIVAFATAAEEARLESVAWMGAWNRHESHASIHSREHWLATRVQRWLPDVQSIYIDPGMFAFTYFLGLPFIVHLGLLALPFGDGANAPPANEDIGQLAAETLVDPERHAGRTYRPTGPDLLSGDDCARILTEVTGRRVRYKAASTREFIKAALALGYPMFEISQVRHFAEDARSGVFAVNAPTDHVETILGRPAEDFATTASRYIASPDLIAPGLRIGSRMHAVKLAIRMLMTRVPNLDAWERTRGHMEIRSCTPTIDSSNWFTERSSLPPAHGVSRNVTPGLC